MSEYERREYIVMYECDGDTMFDMRTNERIVRCRDCVAYEPYHTYTGMKLDYGECMQHRRQTNDDRFCWWAERSDK